MLAMASRRRTRQEMMTHAYHEAGHFVIAAVCGYEVVRVTIRCGRERGRPNYGHCRIGFDPIRSVDNLVPRITTLLAGQAAQALSNETASGEFASKVLDESTGCGGDWVDIGMAVSKVVPDPLREKAGATLLGIATGNLCALWPEFRPTLEEVADLLRQRKTLDARCLFEAEGWLPPMSRLTPEAQRVIRKLNDQRIHGLPAGYHHRYDEWNS